ncbi:hypothetical protein F5I97DRAFT_1935252 [Phlebopus sp. FC_14]|nr:hypothetical protein F5I97DRAFT_1935252 [Phlebopus sp. FC_14]
MPLVTTLIDDKSPLITYDASWTPGTSADSQADQYYLGTFTINNETDGTAKFSFNGTAFWIYGAKRSNHGSYTVQVDDATFANNNGDSPNNLFQQSLFNLSGLSQQLHTVSITNTASGGLYVDIDLIVWQSEVGSDSDQLVPETVEDTDPRFQYQDLAWSTSPSNVNFFSNGTGHTTESYNASATFIFTVREAITLFGATGPSNGPYSVQLDEGQAIKYNATTFTPLYGVTLFHADNLGSGQHEITVTNLPDTNGQSLSIDYAVLLSSSTSSLTTSTDPSQLSSGAIAGVVVSVVAAVVALAAAAFFYRPQSDLYRVYTPQRRPEVTTATTTAFSSSLATSNQVVASRNDTASLAPSRSSDYGYHRLQDSRLAPVNENMEASNEVRHISCAPESGPLLPAETQKTAVGRRSTRTVTSELPPPNYNQAMGEDRNNGAAGL